jgi:predicted alpha/beta superfamily hydrolase
VVESVAWMGRPGGGADTFLEFIELRILPLVYARTQIDRSRQTLWGHSFGGLFAMHVLFTRPALFANYVVGDPSAWWQEGLLYREWQTFDTRLAAGKRIVILHGTRPRTDNKASPASGPLHGRNGERLTFPTALQTMAGGLDTAGAESRYEAYPQYGHGEMLRVSLQRALEVASEP